MRTRFWRLGLLGGLALGASGCSWSRFDEVTENSPVVLLEKPNSMKDGFGVNLATATHEGQTELLVGGTPSVSAAALYDLGDGDSPGTTSVDTGFCSSGSCFLSSLMGGFANASAPDQTRQLCFAVGSGTVVKQGLVVRCKDAHEYTLDLPPVAQELLASSIAKNQPHDHPMVTDRTDDPLLLVSLPDKRMAWFYPANSREFSELELPDEVQVDDASFGRSLAVLAVDGGRVLALGVPGKSRVLLWKTDDDSADSHYIGCLGERSGLGRALAAGKVTKDDDDDLVVSDDGEVHVIDGSALFQLPETTSGECRLSSLPKGALIHSFGCSANSSVSGCEKSEFGAAVAVGDLDGDGDGEVIVGAPKMTVRDKENAGALLIYEADDGNESVFVDAKFISSAEGGDELGRSIVTPHLDKRDIIAAGAPGNGKAALFYCSALLPHGEAGARCP